MSSTLARLGLPLFVPADRLDRFAKAAAAGADAVVLDLEDAVAPPGKAAAREALLAAVDALASSPCPLLVRINAVGTPFHDDDLGAVARLPLAGVMLPKVEDAAEIAKVAQACGLPVVALVESARGVATAREFARSAARLAFGSLDFAADLGCAHTREALLLARCELVLASRLAGLPPPLDGVTTVYKDAFPVEDDARYAGTLGFGGKLLIHPAQIDPARAGFAPLAEDVAWAKRILAAGGDGAVAVDGAMIDQPVRLRAEILLSRAAAGRT